MRNHAVHFLLVVSTALFAAGCASTSTQQSETTPEKKATTETKPAEPGRAAVGTTPSGTASSYNVVRGDHLWGISSKPTIYGNPYQWPLIFKANRDRIQDADLIEPGQVFLIEKNPSGGDVSAAVRHAKTRGEWKIGSTEKSDLDYLGRYGIK